ncbi:gamma-glutamylcyclotransferase [Pandoraea commovens]|uniref:glutathione-specific gamma-glutamylcyclotransferase n=1 Tax=Pandoraea commovens TaxID=2508289 RepID=A0A5E4ST60_9BURK|nr:gamma-glutamylcyclotransferase [Pandoraea commovens]VVD77588.1 gamma-glutamylcyclotransferase [Pandoraea commovens]
MLTRQIIHSGEYLEQFESLPNRWTIERIEQSLNDTMAARGMPNEVWIFGYGSLIWNPMVQFDRRRVATLDGWHRAFCLKMVAGRGNPERPGRMLALRPGGQTQGLAFRLAAASLAEELQVVWVREMILGSYRPTWVTLQLDDGTRVEAVAFVADESSEQYEGDASVSVAAPLIREATGQFGSNADYLFNLRTALHAWQLRDPYINALIAEIERPAHEAADRSSAAGDSR